jgi:hypothetical protein
MGSSYSQNAAVRRSLWLAAVVAGALLSTHSTPHAAQPAVALNVFFGNLHSHTAYSDGTGTPQQAYDHARTVAALDFLAITEHNHRNAGSTGNDPLNLNLGLDHTLYNGPQAASLISTANAVNTQFANTFVALYGQEYSTNSDGNHVNVFDVGEVIDEDVIPNKRFDLFYGSWLPTHLDTTGKPAIVQFNHPKSMNEDYGVLNFGSLAATLTAALPHVRTIQIINGPHDATTSGNRVNTVKSRTYLQYLNAGFRIAPTADQDNHFITHGSATDHRTAVLAPSLTKANILEAIRERHVYASQDKNLRVLFSINGQPLGSVVPMAAGTALRIEVQLTDPDESTANYHVSLRRDVVGGELEADQEFGGGDASGNGTLIFDQFQHSAADEYFLVQVVQIGSDGADVAWTAPIWLVSPSGDIDVHPPDDDTGPGPGTPTHPEEFVWSQNSEVYHLAQCRVVQQIAPQNRRAGHQPPAGKRLHTGCPH